MFLTRTREERWCPKARFFAVLRINSGGRGAELAGWPCRLGQRGTGGWCHRRECGDAVATEEVALRFRAVLGASNLVAGGAVGEGGRGHGSLRRRRRCGGDGGQVIFGG